MQTEKNVFSHLFLLVPMIIHHIEFRFPVFSSWNVCKIFISEKQELYSIRSSGSNRYVSKCSSNHWLCRCISVSGITSEVSAEMLCCQQVIRKITDLTFFNRAFSATQGSDIWHQERQLRITGEWTFRGTILFKYLWTLQLNVIKPAKCMCVKLNNGLGLLGMLLLNYVLPKKLWE